jgi:alpha-tubulin suppressor-like RCC1 family protein
MKIKNSLIQICVLSALLLLEFTSGAQPVTKIAAGHFHSLFLKSDGSLWAMGDNTYGELGDGSNSTIPFQFHGTNFPEQIVASNVTEIAAGNDFSLFFKSDGSLWAMGADFYGELGDGTNGTTPFHYYGTNRPEQIVASGVTAIAAGNGHSLFLKSDGSLWGMGLNDSGQLGDGTFNNTNRPELIMASNVTAIAAGDEHSLFLMTDGSIWGMGLNSSGQLGDGSYNSTNHPEQIVVSNVMVIAAGAQQSLFLKIDSSLWGMGYNGGSLGDGSNDKTNRPEQIVASNITAVVSGLQHSLFLKNDGSLWGMGFNMDGELGDGTYISTNRPEKIVASGVTAITAGTEHSLFLKSDGSLWDMGRNSDGELGDGTHNGNTNRVEQILAAYNQIFVQLLGGGNVSFSFVGIAGANYALDRSFSLSPVNWFPQATNPANSLGTLVFTNMPNPATNNFWRIRSVP